MLSATEVLLLRW